MRLTEDDIKEDLEEVYGFANNAEKLAWRRKYKKMQEALEELTPYEEEILRLHKEKQPIMDKIEEIRAKMVEECVHPKEFLVHKGTHVECKFCGKLINPRKRK
jgi:hypothetical protein